MPTVEEIPSLDNHRSTCTVFWARRMEGVLLMTGRTCIGLCGVAQSKLEEESVGRYRGQLGPPRPALSVRLSVASTLFVRCMSEGAHFLNTGAVRCMQHVPLVAH